MPRAVRPVRNPALRRRRIARALALALVVALALPAQAAALRITPESGGSPNADEISTLYAIVLAIAVVIFLIVEGALLYSLIKFRWRKGRKAAQIHGNTRLELGWTIGAALLLVVLATITFIKLPTILDPPNGGPNGLAVASADSTPRRAILSASTTAPSPPNGRKLTITVTGRQYVWRYTYGPDFASPYSYETMVAPADTVVVLKIQATDVIHSWWIPEMGGKFDAVPGYTNYTWFKAPMPADPVRGDTYTGQCAELCGRHHANMLARVRIVSPAVFRAWLAGQKQRIRRANLNAERLRRQLQAQGQIS